MSGRDELRLFLFEFTEHKVFNVSILLVIFLNTIFIGLQTSKEIMAKSGTYVAAPCMVTLHIASTLHVRALHTGWYLTMVDNTFLAIYIVEFLLKFYAWRLRYFKLGWNIFDIQLCEAALLWH